MKKNMKQKDDSKQVLLSLSKFDLIKQEPVVNGLLLYLVSGK